MNLETLQKEMINAMKEKNRVKKQVLSDIIALAKNIAIEKKSKDNVSEDMVSSAILKVQKTAQEQIDTCPSTRTDLLEEYNLYLSYMKEYAPQMMGEAEIAAEVDKVIADISGPVNKGVIMKQLMPKLKGKADGKMINKIVEEKLK